MLNVPSAGFGLSRWRVVSRGVLTCRSAVGRMHGILETAGMDCMKSSRRSMSESALPGCRAADAASVRDVETSERLASGVRRNGPGLWRFFVLRCDAETAEELMQETCYQATRSLPDGLDGEELDRWLFGVARNVLRRHWRTLRRRGRNLPPEPGDPEISLAGQMDAGPLPADLAESRETRRAVLEALSSLPAAQQDLLLDCYARGLSQQDLAEKHRTSVRAIEGRLYRARAFLREQLRQPEDLP